MDTYRAFVVKYYHDEYKKWSEEKHTTKLYAEGLNREVLAKIQSFGSESMLPQNLPNFLLFPLEEMYCQFIEDCSQENDIDSNYSVVLVQIIVLLKGAQENLTSDDWNKEIQISVDELNDHISNYLLYLAFEKFNRVLGLGYSKPNIETIFDINHRITFNPSDDFFDI